jgi:hypothetical protein
MTRQSTRISKSYTDDKTQLQSVTDEVYDLYTSKLSFDGNLPSSLLSVVVQSGSDISLPPSNSIGWKLVGASIIFVEDNTTVTSIKYGNASITPTFSDGGSHRVTVLCFFN